LTGGVSQIFFLRRLVDEVQQDWPAVLGRLEEIRRTLINRNTVVCNITLDSENWSEFRPSLAGFLAALPAAPAEIARWVPEEFAGAPEGLTFPAKVNYVAKGANLYDQGYELHGSCAVITHYLRATYLWERIRVQGGAYGAFCAFNRHSGLFTYGSYRDPNLLATLDNYDQASDFLRNLDLPDDELTKSIIGAIGAIDAYQLPDAKGYSSMQRHLIGYADEERQAFRDEVFATKWADFRSFAGALDGLNQAGLIVALGSEDAIEAANAERDHMFTVTKVL
jgi:Zn-dependent M16 (insulinase) family peptidase